MGVSSYEFFYCGKLSPAPLASFEGCVASKTRMGVAAADATLLAKAHNLHCLLPCSSWMEVRCSGH